MVDGRGGASVVLTPRAVLSGLAAVVVAVLVVVVSVVVAVMIVEVLVVVEVVVVVVVVAVLATVVAVVRVVVVGSGIVVGVGSGMVVGVAEAVTTMVAVADASTGVATVDTPAAAFMLPLPLPSSLSSQVPHMAGQSRPHTTPTTSCVHKYRFFEVHLAGSRMPRQVLGADVCVASVVTCVGCSWHVLHMIGHTDRRSSPARGNRQSLCSLPVHNLASSSRPLQLRMATVVATGVVATTGTRTFAHTPHVNGHTSFISLRASQVAAVISWQMLFLSVHSSSCDVLDVATGVVGRVSKAVSPVVGASVVDTTVVVGAAVVSKLVVGPAGVGAFACGVVAAGGPVVATAVVPVTFEHVLHVFGHVDRNSGRAGLLQNVSPNVLHTSSVSSHSPGPPPVGAAVVDTYVVGISVVGAAVVGSAAMWATLVAYVGYVGLNCCVVIAGASVASVGSVGST